MWSAPLQSCFFGSSPWLSEGQRGCVGGVDRHLLSSKDPCSSLAQTTEVAWHSGAEGAGSEDLGIPGEGRWQRWPCRDGGTVSKLRQSQEVPRGVWQSHEVPRRGPPPTTVPWCRAAGRRAGEAHVWCCAGTAFAPSLKDRKKKKKNKEKRRARVEVLALAQANGYSALAQRL